MDRSLQRVEIVRTLTGRHEVRCCVCNPNAVIEHRFTLLAADRIAREHNRDKHAGKLRIETVVRKH